jgi:hypothetical protein
MEDDYEPNVVSGVIDTKTGNVRLHGLEELNARDAVIEAAKVSAMAIYESERAEARHKLHLAIEALLAAEGE